MRVFTHRSSRGNSFRSARIYTLPHVSVFNNHFDIKLKIVIWFTGFGELQIYGALACFVVCFVLIEDTVILIINFLIKPVTLSAFENSAVDYCFRYKFGISVERNFL